MAANETLNKQRQQKVGCDLSIQIGSRTSVNTKSHSSSSPESKSLNPSCLYAIGGSDTNILSSVSKLDSRTNKWTASTPMPCPRVNFGCAVIGRKIYICGGGNGKKNMNELTVYDTDTEQWTQLQPMKYTRQGCAMAALDGFLYVAGGYKGWPEGISSVVERYSVENNKWETVTPMTNRRDGLELVSMNGFLYAIGGNDERDRWRSVERYSPQTNEWKAVASLSNGYSSFGSAVLNNRIYVADGDNCEVYDLEKEKWEFMKVPTKCFYALKMAVHNNKLFAIGGLDEGRKKGGMKRFERFDFEANSWVAESDMNIARCCHGVAVVESS